MFAVSDGSGKSCMATAFRKGMDDLFSWGGQAHEQPVAAAAHATGVVAGNAESRGTVLPLNPRQSYTPPFHCVLPNTSTALLRGTEGADAGGNRLFEDGDVFDVALGLVLVLSHFLSPVQNGFTFIHPRARPLSATAVGVGGLFKGGLFKATNTAEGFLEIVFVDFGEIDVLEVLGDLLGWPFGLLHEHLLSMSRRPASCSCSLRER